jgi:hypothetical protein
VNIIEICEEIEDNGKIRRREWVDKNRWIEVIEGKISIGDGLSINDIVHNDWIRFEESAYNKWFSGAALKEKTITFKHPWNGAIDAVIGVCRNKPFSCRAKYFLEKLEALKEDL